MKALLLLALLAPDNDYLPLQPGGSMTYLVEDVGAEAVHPASEVVSRVGPPASTLDDDWLHVSNYLGYSDCWLRTNGPVIELKLEGKIEAPAMTILKSTAKTGDTWTGTLGRETLTFTLRGEDLLELGDHRVKALHVEYSAAADRHPGHAPTRGDVWFAERLGIVKAQVTTDLDCHTATSKVYTLKP